MQEGEVIGGKYELSRLIATGAMGTVFEAFHVQLRRRIAVKFLREELCNDKEATARFIREAQAAAAIGSEHIAPVTDVGQTDDGLPFLVMEYLEGQTLARAMRADRQFEIVRAATLGLQLCWALTAAHDKGIIHRDIKPDNVFLVPRADGSEHVKVLDFGIAKMLVTMTADQAQLTAQGTTLGTPYYMAPEQARGERDIDGRADVYSIGVLLYEMLTGRQPFMGGNFTAIVVAASTTDPEPPRTFRPDLPKSVEKLVLRAMARDRDERYSTARELADALEPLTGARASVSAPPELMTGESTDSGVIPVQGPPTAVMPKVAVQTPAQQRTRRLFVIGFVGVLVVMALVGAAFLGGFMISQRGVEDDPPPPPVDGQSADPSSKAGTKSSAQPETPVAPPANKTPSDDKPDDDASGGAPPSLPPPPLPFPPPLPPGEAVLAPEKRPLKEVLPEAARHLQRERFKSCITVLQGMEDSPSVSLLRLKCFHGAGRKNEACHVAQTCSDQPYCKSYFDRRCKR